MSFLPSFIRGDKDRQTHLEKVATIVARIEAEMQRIGYWKERPPAQFAPKELYAGVSFEEWLQFVFLTNVRRAIEEKELRTIPPYRVGVAALRQYDYHSEIPEAHQLMHLCHELEETLPPLEHLVGPNQPPEPMPLKRHGSS